MKHNHNTVSINILKSLEAQIRKEVLDRKLAQITSERKLALIEYFKKLIDDE